MSTRNQKRRDWFRVVRDLMAAGISMNKIARFCGKSCAGVVQHWADGGEPKDTDARTVLALYKKHCPELYLQHMREFDPDVLDLRPVVWVKPDGSLRGRPRPQAVAVRQVDHQKALDFFFAEETT